MAKSEQAKKPFLFVSYSWDHVTQDDVRKVARVLIALDLYEVWIDENNMQTEDVNEQMAENVARADLVLIFFNNYYQERPNCQKEAKLADKYKKKKLFINMEKGANGPLRIEKWFDAIILNDIFISYYKERDPIEKVISSVRSKLAPEDKPIIYMKELFVAAEDGKLERCRELLAKGADVNAKNAHDKRIGWGGSSALLYAALRGHCDVAELLIEHGADVNQVNQLGASPLIFAAYHDQPKAVALLLKHGADVTLKHRNEKTALDLAEEAGNADIVKLLKAAAAEKK